MTETIQREVDAVPAAQEPVPPGGRRRHVPRRPLKSLAKHLVLIVTGAVMIYPLLWMVVSSLRPDDLIFSQPGLWLSDVDLSHYPDGWNALTHPFGRYMLNSAIVVLGSVLGTLVSCSMAAYAFARMRFSAKTLLFAIMLITIMLPGHVTLVPQYVLFSQLGMVNTFWPLVGPNMLATDSFFIFLMVQFIRGLPKELDEAARIDGAGHARIFLRIILPLMTPALATTAIFTFIGTWNQFFSALIYLTDTDMMTVPVALRLFVDSQGESNWGSMFAMSIVSLLPVFFVFLFGQRFLIRGIATTGIK
ncbi:carbohydrate ABC transporter membrane protein 2, CUT1 family (TC 3.A.1.1.-) [Krasilnikoviella flava]|uniref:Carbohydrate ABC transporter membrane protein 2, CUT1 family (TC 3.A.1.1.-) n=2 Tax=Krasilnikoviella flava TaxID=526729 RepID=A0A1T5K7G6_9MICO|nr:carbohydrate ABC transporter permease [Krasilnikoviella flava]SKC59465.1 carbohydrate ABC transporter membrane protein 2, CUT1 family (TC 3.A.1.1.-) [Krasilnikoviella flava]